MAAKKWFGLAAVVAAIGAGTAYAVTKIKGSPEAASNLYDGAKQKAKESPDRAAEVLGAAKAKVMRSANEAESEGADGDEEVVDDVDGEDSE